MLLTSPDCIIAISDGLYLIPRTSSTWQTPLDTLLCSSAQNTEEMQGTMSLYREFTFHLPDLLGEF